jgi:hypothetical protein
MHISRQSMGAGIKREQKGDTPGQTVSPSVPSGVLQNYHNTAGFE